MNGAQALITTLVDGGVDVCFANPGTSEMHFVAALDTVPRMRGVLTLFEGVATGAADGYARIAGRPAAVLLHLGPGLGNGLANLHNARRAHVPMVVVVGDHATYHKKYDAPLESDIDALAGTVSGWVRRSVDSADVGRRHGRGHRGSRARSADLDVDPARGRLLVRGPPTGNACRSWIQRGDVRPAADVLAVLRSGEPTMMLIGGDATRAAGLAAAVADRAGNRGAGCYARRSRPDWSAAPAFPAVDRLAYFAEAVAAQLDGVKHLVLAGAKSPVSFFAYPDMPSDLVPAGCEVHMLAGYDGAADALAALADELAPGTTAPVAPLSRPQLPSGALTSASAADVIGALMPERAIVVDESNTSGLPLEKATAGAPAHDWLTLTGGAIGYAIPTAVGAAVAAPDRPVLCLESDGSAMYTISGLWTQARENLNVTTVVYDNSAYDILRVELQRVGAGSGPGPEGAETSLTYPVPQWISSRSREAWEFLPVASAPPRNSPTRCVRRSPNPDRT